MFKVGNQYYVVTIRMGKGRGEYLTCTKVGNKYVYFGSTKVDKDAKYIHQSYEGVVKAYQTEQEYEDEKYLRRLSHRLYMATNKSQNVWDLLDKDDLDIVVGLLEAKGVAI